MDPGRAKKLSALVWRERVKTAALIVIPAVLLGLLILALTLNRTPAEREQLNGVVVNWTRKQTETGSGAYVIEVALASGERITAIASRYGRAPGIGERIRVDRVKTLTGAVRYEWTR